MDEHTPDDVVVEPVEEPLQALVQAPKKKKPAPVPAGNPKRDAARARVKELMARKTP